MMTTFSIGLAWTIIEGVKEFYQELPKNYEDAGYSAIRHVGIQDDQYFRVPAAVFPQFSRIMETKLARDGHILQPAKCAVWIPALDCMWNEAAYPPEITDITSRFHLAKGGILALGTFAHGSYSTLLKITPGGQTYPDLSMVQKRVTQTLNVIHELEQMLVHQASNRTYHAAFIILQRSVSHAFDYDARLVGAAALQSVTTHAADRTLEVITHLMGECDDHARNQVTLIGQFGGCFLRCVVRDGYAQAAMWSAHVTNLKMRKSIAERLDCPPPFASEEVVAAAQSLKEWEIEVWNQGLAVTAELKAHYESTPWAKKNYDGRTCGPNREADQRPTYRDGGCPFSSS